MDKEQLVNKIQERIKILQKKQEHWWISLLEFSNLDNKLKARKEKGEQITKEDPDVQRLFTLGKELNWKLDKKPYKDKDLHFQTAIDELEFLIRDEIIVRHSGYKPHHDEDGDLLGIPLCLGIDSQKYPINSKVKIYYFSIAPRKSLNTTSNVTGVQGNNVGVDLSTWGSPLKYNGLIEDLTEFLIQHKIPFTSNYSIHTVQEFDL